MTVQAGNERRETWVRVDQLKVGERIRVPGHNGQDGVAAVGTVDRVKGPHGPLGTPPTTDWYTLQVLFDEAAGLVGHGRHTSTVGPRRGADEVLAQFPRNGL